MHINIHLATAVTCFKVYVNHFFHCWDTKFLVQVMFNYFFPEMNYFQLKMRDEFQNDVLDLLRDLLCK